MTSLITTDEILATVQAYNPAASLDKIKKAFEFSAQAHAGQKRRSGEPYLIHPLEVAKTLTQLKMDVSTIIAAILHDTIEDTGVKKEQIEKEFGEDVADIVDGVTKISKLQFSSQEDRQAENYRKMILAMSKDIRVIMVKLADRLNNIRTLQFLPENKQIKIAQETLDIYAPIAGRMGIYWIKEELEEYSLKFLKTQVYEQIRTRLDRLLKKREDYMQKVIDTVIEHTKDSVKKLDISGRIKSTYSVYKKMQRQQIGLEDVHDLMAFRILVESIEQCYEVLGTIHTLWKPIQGRFKDYIAMPKANNYQSVHTTVLCFDNERVEFQIRSFEMHEIADKGIAAHWKYKSDGRLETKDEEKFSWLRQLVDWQQQLKDSIEFVDTVKLDLFEDEIFVFTPTGDLKRLPHGASPVDFAYEIHSDIGDHCTGARVNGKIVPLNHKLESGDSVEIIANKKQLPNKDWLDFVASTKAKTHIRQFIRQQQREKSISIGRNLLEAECQKRKIALNKFLKMEEFERFLQDKKIKDTDELYSTIAYGKMGARTVIEAILPADVSQTLGLQPDTSVFKRMMNKFGPKSKNLILVDEQDGVLVTFGKCCNPVRGDSILGFVTRGRGVAIHRKDCTRVLNIDPDRRVEVAWNETNDQVSIARIVVVAEDKRGVLADITSVISEHDINIDKVLVKAQQEGMSRLVFDLCVKNATQLRALMRTLEALKFVVSVSR